MDEQNINTNVAESNGALSRSTAKEENPFIQQSTADTGAEQGAEQGSEQVDTPIDIPLQEDAAVAQEDAAVAQEDAQAAVLEDAQAAVPEDAAAVPEDAAAVPEDAAVVPEDAQAAVPEDAQAAVPEDAGDIGDEITLKIGKSTLVSLCQNLNTNLLVNIAAYKSVLAKLKDSEKDETKNAALNSNIETLNALEYTVSELLNTVQTNLDIPDDKKIDPKTVIEEASSPDASSGNFMTKLLGAEAAAILGSMAAATVLMLGGGKYKRRKFTKRRRNKKQKSTKSNKK